MQAAIYEVLVRISKSMERIAEALEREPQTSETNSADDGAEQRADKPAVVSSHQAARQGAAAEAALPAASTQDEGDAE